MRARRKTAPTLCSPVVRLTAGPELEDALRVIEDMRKSPFWNVRELAI
jgi:hypothetical protein